MITINNSWKAEIDTVHGFLALVKFTLGDDTTFSRLDIGKRWFIDETPVEVPYITRLELVDEAHFYASTHPEPTFTITKTFDKGGSHQ